MTLIVKNVNTSLTLSLSSLRLTGMWASETWKGMQLKLYYCYAFVFFMYCTGYCIFIQSALLVTVWGDLAQMAACILLLFTNTAQVAKIVNVMWRKARIQRIIDEADQVLRAEDSMEGKKIIRKCNREIALHHIIYQSFAMATVIGWSSSTKKRQLPLQSWYPYDTSKSPAFELTYFHQVSAIFLIAFLNINKDMIVCAIIAQCRCRLQLLVMSLKHLGRDLPLSEKGLLTPEQEHTVRERLLTCVREHQAVLQAVLQVQDCFSEPTFQQFTVSSFIICTTAYQLVSETGNLIRLLSMGTYLMGIMCQVFVYCYQGHHLSEESSEVAGAVYECPWYACSARLRRDMLVVMARTRRIARITAGGFTTLSLASFTSIIKASYSLFMLLRQVTEK